MKKLRTISIIISAIMAMTSIGATSVNAYNGINPNENTYTLNELLDMSDEQFLLLENSLIPGGAQGVYDFVDKNSRGEWLITIESEYYNKIGGIFILDTIRDFYYNANFTENLIHELLADSPYEYEEFSPINKLENSYYNWYYNVEFPELGVDIPSKDLPEATDENVMTVAKILYCLKQVCPNFSWGGSSVILSGISENPNSGDVNVDEKIDLYDAVWIAYDMMGTIELTEGQKSLGDVNADGVCDLYDAIEISRKMLLGYVSMNSSIDNSQQTIADFNNDGIINVADILAVNTEHLSDVMGN